MQHLPFFTNILAVLVPLAALWHVVGFAFGFVYVRASLLSLWGVVTYDRAWSRILKSADLHLWLSGFALILLGIAQKGAHVYLSDPKLLAKMTIVTVWFLSTQAMRHAGIPRLRKGDTRLMKKLAALNVSCWIYGAWLGCARPLAGGVATYAQFLIGFLFVTVGTFSAIYYVHKKIYLDQ